MIANDIVLASGSPRRRTLLENCGLHFQVYPSDALENPVSGESPKQMVERLALLKAETVAIRFPRAYVIGCDTDVFLDGQALGKPVDRSNAIQLLKTIQGRAHSVWGAFAILHKEKSLRIVHSDETKVSVIPMSDATVEAYVASGEPMDKAGAYAAQGIGAQFIDRIEGSYTTVVGLNICAFMQVARQLNLIYER